MNNRLSILASLVMDAYYQQYGKESDFFKLKDFMSYCNIFYYQVLQEDYDKSRREMIQLGFLEIGDEAVMNLDWYIDKEVVVKKENNRFYIDLETVSISKDIGYSGLKDIYSNGSCGKFAKITYHQKDTLKFYPKSDNTIYFYPLGKRVYFENVNCGLDKVNVVHIPTLDSEANDGDIIVPNILMAEIVTRCYNFMTASKNGAIIDKTNNQNPNKIIQTEIDENGNRG